MGNGAGRVGGKEGRKEGGMEGGGVEGTYTTVQPLCVVGVYSAV